MPEISTDKNHLFLPPAVNKARYRYSDNKKGEGCLTLHLFTTGHITRLKTSRLICFIRLMKDKTFLGCKRYRTVIFPHILHVQGFFFCQ
jgi:hypothetical protein